MTTVVEVGPDRVRGPGAVAAELESAALDFIDDDLGLLGAQPVAVEHLWRDALTAAADGPPEAVVLVCPSWWSTARVARIREAAGGIAVKADVLQRSQLLGSEAAAVVEFGPGFVLVFRPHVPKTVLARGDPRVVDAVADEVAGCPTVLVDAPGQADVELAAAMVRRLRVEGGVTVTQVDHRRIRAAVAGRRQSEDAPRPPAGRRMSRRGLWALTGATVCVALVGAGFAAPRAVRPAADSPMMLLVEGRVGVRVPALWSVQRVTVGPGSARVQVVSPSDPGVAVHVTQSAVRQGQTPTMVADALRAALDEQPPGVFVDFVAVTRRAGREVTGYRELRDGHHTRWAVLVDDGVRIGIGCQSPPNREDRVRYACDEAIRSAQAVS